MMDTMTITEFLLARIAEDEAVARAATEEDVAQARKRRWSDAQQDGTLKIKGSIMESMGWDFGGGSGIWQCDDPYDDCAEYHSIAAREAAHIVRHDPARVLAECEAKRRIVELHHGVETDWIDADGDDRSAEFCATCDRGGDPSDTWPCETLKTLALPYADHPAYEAAWIV